MKHDRRDYEDKINIQRFDPADFWEICPYSMAELIGKNRETQVKTWRHYGMFWLWMSGATMSHSSNQFNKNHATLINAIKRIEDVLSGHLRGYDREVLQTLVNHVTGKHLIKPSYEHEALLTLQNKMK